MKTWILTLSLSLFAASCSSDGGLQPSDSFTLTIQNSFSTALQVEIWRGDNLSYNNGTVYGDSLAKLKEVTAISTGSNNLETMKNEEYDVLLIFGDGTANNYYWNEYELDSPLGDVSLTISSTGLITRN